MHPDALAKDRDALQQVLRRLGDLTPGRVRGAHAEGYSAESMLAKLERERRAAKVRIAGEERWIAAEDAGLYRDALGVPPPARAPGLLPRRRSTTRCSPSCAATRAPTGRSRRPRSARALRDRPRPGAQGARAIRRAGPRRAASRRHRARVVRRGRAAPRAPGQRRGAFARRPRRWTPPSSPASCPPGRTWMPTGPPGRARPPARGAGPAPGRRAHAGGLGARRAAAPPRRLQPGLARPADDQRRGGVDRRRARSAGPAGWRSTSARTSDSPARRRRTRSSSGPRARSTTRSASGSPARRRSGSTSSPSSSSTRGAPRRALGPRLGGRGDQRRVRAAARPAAHRGPASQRRRRGGSPRAAGRRGQAVQGRWSLTESLFRDAPPAGPRLRAQAELMLERYGIVTRETVLAEGVPGGFSSALRRALEPRDAGHRPPRLLRRGPRRRPVRARRRGRAPARPARAPRASTCCSPPPIPPSPYGAALPWPKRAGGPAPGAHPGRLRPASRRQPDPLRRARRQGHRPPRRARGRGAGRGGRRARRGGARQG